MPPFQYSPFVDPYAASVGDLLAHRGEIEARRAERIAAAQARAAEVGGQAWAGAAQNLGQIAANTASTIQRERVEAPIRAQEARLRDIQVADAERKDLDARRARGISSAMDAALNGSLTKDPATGITTYDRNKLLANMAEVGVPQSEIARYLPVLDAADGAIATAKKAHIEALKHSAALVEMAGNDPSVFKAEIQRGIANGLFTKDEAQPYLDAAAQDPTHIARITGALQGKDPNAGQFTLNPGEVRFGADNKPLATNPKPPETPSMQSKDVLLDGKAALVSFNPKTGTYHDASGADVTPRVRPMPPASVQVNAANAAAFPGDWDKTGEAFLGTIPVQWRATVKKIASYDEDPTKVASMRGGMREKLMAWVNQVNPSYDQSVFANRNPTRKAFTTGTQGQQINAINTAIGHIDQLTDQITALGNGNFTPGNKAVNYFRTQFGSEKVTNFDTLKDALAGEVASILSKGTATVSGIEEAKAKIHASNSPAQLAGYMKTLIPLMGSKLSALDYQYHQAMGEGDDFSALSPQTKAVLQKHGFDPSGHGGQVGVGQSINVGGFTVTVK